MNKNITLVGMPGVGKTYLGKRLGKKLEKSWVDLDTASYSGTISAGGTEEDFMEKEEQVLLSAKGEGCIFSTGGSCIYSKKGMEHLRKISKIIYLELPFAIIEKRLGDFSARGVVKGQRMTLKELFDERTPLYENFADFTVTCQEDSTEKQLSLLYNLLNDDRINI